MAEAPGSSAHQARTPNLFGIYLANMLQGFGVSVLAALLPTYAELLEASPLWIGAFSSVFATATIISVLPLGWLADRWGQRNILLAGLVVIAASYAGFMLVRDVVSLTIVQFVQGLGTTAATITCLSLTGDLARHEARGRAIGTVSSLEALANAAGAAAGGWLYLRFGFTATYTLLMVATLAGAVIVCLQVPEGPPPTRRALLPTFGAILSNRRIQSVAGYRFVFSFGKNIMRTFVPAYAGVVLDMNSAQVGTLIAAERTVNMLLQRFGGSLSDRFGRLPVVTAGTGLFTAGILLALTQESFVGLLIAQGVMGLADSARVPAEMALFADEGRNLGSASTFSVRSIIYRPGAVLGPLLGGAVMEWFGIQPVFALAAVFTLTALAVLLVVRRVTPATAGGQA